MTHKRFTGAILSGAACAVTLCMAGPAAGAPWIVEEGQPRAEIVIAAQPPRSVRLAAAELQTNLFLISGATLPIVHAPTADVPVQLYVGRSPDTDRLEVTDADLPHGAFRMVSGENWLVLLGQDRDFVPPEPLMKNSADLPRVTEAWDRLTGEQWSFPFTQLWKERNATLNIWEQDQRGSYNAVCAFLRTLGVRWYMPGALGTILPRQRSLALPAVNQTVHPDFPVRFPYQYGKKFNTRHTDEVLWQMRMGFEQAPDLLGVAYIGHGTAWVISRDEVKQAHPEYYALIGGERQNGKKYQPCLSSPGLLEQDVKRARFMFDHYKAPMVSVMPTDGFTAICQCESCTGQAEPERGWSGQFSDYVWGYVERVAREAYRTHPEHKIIAMAYGSYLLPPRKLAQLSPNIVVCIAQHRAGRVTETATMDTLRADYQKLLPAGSRQLMLYDYYLSARAKSPLRHFPVLFPRAAAADLAALNGISLGDYIEVFRDQREMGAFALQHLNLYVTGRCWWDADLDVEALLEEYCTLFYGPARDAMRSFIEYCEASAPAMRREPARIDRVFELLESAQAKTEPESAYAQRIELIADYLAPLRGIQSELSKGRENVPRAVLADRDGRAATLDGRLDEAFWDDMPEYALRDLATGAPPLSKGSFKIAWADGSLYVGILCREPDMANLNIAAVKNKDTSIWMGDCVEILLETPVHSHYQIAISPAGAVMDMDRAQGFNSHWMSNAEVAAFRGADSWSLEVRIPVANELQAEIDPLNGVSGARPSAENPWYFNVCRQRMRGQDQEYSAFSPTIKGGFNVVRKFAELVSE